MKKSENLLKNGDWQVRWWKNDNLPIMGESYEKWDVVVQNKDKIMKKHESKKWRLTDWKWWLVTLFVQVNHKDEDAHTFDFILFLIFMQECKVSFLELSLRKS